MRRLRWFDFGSFRRGTVARIIHAQVANGKIGYALRRLLTDRTQDSFVARADEKSIKQPLARKTDSDIAKRPDQFRSSRRLPRVDCATLGKHPQKIFHGQCPVGTAKPADGHPPLHGNTLPGKILQAAGIADQAKSVLMRSRELLGRRNPTWETACRGTWRTPCHTSQPGWSFRPRACCRTAECNGPALSAER